MDSQHASNKVVQIRKRRRDEKSYEPYYDECCVQCGYSREEGRDRLTNTELQMYLKGTHNLECDYERMVPSLCYVEDLSNTLLLLRLFLHNGFIVSKR
jgi:hypothetical protein